MKKFSKNNTDNLNESNSNFENEEFNFESMVKSIIDENINIQINEESIEDDIKLNGSESLIKELNNLYTNYINNQEIILKENVNKKYFNFIDRKEIDEILKINGRI